MQNDLVLETSTTLIDELKKRVEFYEDILNNLPAIIYVNQIDQNGDLQSLKSIWSNKWAQDFIGYTQDEISKLGIDFVKRIYHPEDFGLTPRSLEQYSNNNRAVFYTLSRMKPKNQEKYFWIHTRTTNLKEYPDGKPRQSLNVGFELPLEIHSETQLANLLKEIHCLKSALKLKSLTKREREILRLIASGLTDKEISKTINISNATAKTHRNKIIKKLGLKNSASLAAFAVECGL